MFPACSTRSAAAPFVWSTIPAPRLAEAPALAAFLPALARRLLGEDLRLASQATLWLGEGAVVRTVLRDLEGWLITTRRPMATRRPIVPMMLSAADRERNSPPGWQPTRRRMRPRSLRLRPSPPAPGSADWRPNRSRLRMFMTFDGTRWRALPGGLARALSEEDALAGRLPRNALSKDVWVMEEEASTVQGALALFTPTLAIRRTSGDLPSRVADNFYWLGRYLERLEEAARLQRAIITRILRPSPTAREIAEMQILVASLTKVKMMDAEDASVLGAGMLASAVMRAFRHDGGMRRVLAHVARQVEQLRDRLTGEMHTVLTRSLRILGENMKRLPADANARSLE